MDWSEPCCVCLHKAILQLLDIAVGLQLLDIAVGLQVSNVLNWEDLREGLTGASHAALFKFRDRVGPHANGQLM